VSQDNSNASEKVPNLSKDRTYADFQLSKKDWDRLEVIHEVLQVHVPFYYSTGLISHNSYHRSHPMYNRHFPMNKHPLYGELSPLLSSLPSTGSLWLDNLNTAMSRRQSLKESKASKNGITKLIIPQLHILSASVCSHISKNINGFQLL
jgi:hypothetical protein